MNTTIRQSTIFRVDGLDFVAPEYYLAAFSVKSKQVITKLFNDYQVNRILVGRTVLYDKQNSDKHLFNTKH